MKTFFYRARIPVLEWYFVAATCYFCILGMNWSMLVVAIILGFVHTYLVEPIVDSLKSDMLEVTEKVERKSEEFLSWEKYKVLKECSKSFLVCCLVYGFYYVMNRDLTVADEEFLAVSPYTFGLLYWILDKTFGKLIKKWH